MFRRAAVGALALALGFAVHPAAAASTADFIGPPVTVGTAGDEPTMAVGPGGALYISALQYLYASTDGGARWRQVSPVLSKAVFASDSSITIDPRGRLYFAINYPYAGVDAVCNSTDRAASFSCNPAAFPGGNDRQWIYAPGAANVYLTTNEGLEQTVLLVSHDHGRTFTPVETASQMNPDRGEMLIRRGSTELLQPVDTGSRLGMDVFDTTGKTAETAAPRPTPLPDTVGLPAAGFDANGVLYTVSEAPYHGGKAVVVARSSDQGRRWTKLPPIPATTSGTATFATLAAGRAGQVGVLYYWTPATSGLAKARWDAVFAETTNATASRPGWRVQTVDRDVHRGPICFNAGCSASGRFSGDFISAAFDDQGRPHLSWCKDLYRTTPDGLREIVAIRYAGPLG
jgi:hypothetical protein